MREDIMLEIRKSVKSKVLREYAKDVCRALVWCAILMTALFFSTGEGKVLSFEKTPIPVILCYALIATFFICRYRLWRVFLMREWQGRVVRVKTKTVRVTNRRRNVGYVSGLRDMMLVPSYELTVETEGGKQYTVELNDHLSGVGWECFPEGARAQLIRGAKVPWNPDRLSERSVCVYCGYCGSSNEINCTDCGCRMLPARLSDAKIEK